MLEETERPKKRRWNVIENDIKRAGVGEEDSGDRIKWKLRTAVTEHKL